MIGINQNLKIKILLVFFLFVGFFSAYFLSENLAKNTPTDPPKITATAINAKLDDSKPQYFYVKTSTAREPKLSAEAYMVGDLGTGEIIFAKNKDTKLPIASISKLITALVSKELGKDTETAKISKKAVATYGGNGSLKAGEDIKVGELLYPLLLESSNDAAEAIAEFFGRDQFIARMNDGAKSLKMINTSFLDPSGLSEKNISTAEDIFKLAGYLYQSKPDLLFLTHEKIYKNKKHIWSNISQFLNRDGYLGGKSGYIDESLQTAVSVFALPLGETGTRPIGIALLRSKNRQRDVDTIVKFLRKNIYYGGTADANTDWIKERLTLPDIEQNFVDLAFVGDIMLDRGVKNSVIKKLAGDYSALFPKGEILKRADIVFGNLEGTASDKGKDLGSLYSFHMDPAVVPALKNAGFNIFSMANNHVGDWGSVSYTDTLSRLKENEIAYTGGGMNKAEAENPRIIEEHGMKIGFLGFSDVGPKFLEVKEDSAGLLLVSDPRFAEIVQNASKQVDHLIVSFHFGEEYKPIHNARQEDLAHKAIDNGAKIVVGHHPHVAQDTEVYKNGYIMYSLGNFLFDQSWSAPTMQGLLVEIRLDKWGGITVKKNITKQNKFFQIDRIISGKEERLKFSPQSL